MAEYDIKALKSGGFMKQKEKDLFSLRLRMVGGFLKARQLDKLSEIAEKYGKGYVHLTTRQGVEIPNVRFADVQKVKEELAEVDLEMGACGQRVRTVTACQGKECSHGLIDSLSLAREIDERYFGIGGHPHKFKIAISELGAIPGSLIGFYFQHGFDGSSSYGYTHVDAPITQWSHIRILSTALTEDLVAYQPACRIDR